MASTRWRTRLAVAALTLTSFTYASLGDRLPEFKHCLATCKQGICEDQALSIRMVITAKGRSATTDVSQALHRRMLLWTCPAECDYACQHVVTDTRLARAVPYMQPVYQFHGKWPFYRFLGMQEPFSVLFSLMNYLAHFWGVSQLRAKIPETYALRKFYLLFGYFGFASWIASMVFHTRDYNITEKIDYFAAGASVLYGLYYSPIRIFRLDDPQRNQPWKHSVVRLWTLLCLGLYISHVCYLSFWSWDYTYNMAANIAVGITQNLLWTSFAWTRYMKSGRWWQAWPGMIVAWIVLAMSLEVLDFVPWRLMIDAHSLWHLGTVGPTIWWYSFLIRDAQEDLQDLRYKA